MPSHKRFHYHASSLALAGELTRPVQRSIETQAGTSLSTVGGVGAAHVEDFRLDEVVSFRRGSSHVSGSVKTEGNTTIHTTHATATIEGLNILDVVTADRIVARLSSSFEQPAPGRPRPTEGKVLLLGSKFENLRFAGYQLDVELDHEIFLELGTFAAVKESWDQPGSNFRRATAETARIVFGAVGPQNLELHDALLCSLVKEVHFKEPGFGKRQGAFNHPGVRPLGRHAYHVVDFGTIYLAEVLCQHGRKTLTMLRVELGSPNGGSVLTAEASINGWPPWG